MGWVEYAGYSGGRKLADNYGTDGFNNTQSLESVMMRFLPLLMCAAILGSLSSIDAKAADIEIKPAVMQGSAPDAIRSLGTSSADGVEVATVGWPLHYRYGYRNTVRYRPYSTVYRSRTYGYGYGFGYRPYYYGHHVYRPGYSYYRPSYTVGYRYGYRPYSYGYSSRLWYSPYAVGHSNFYRPYYSYAPTYYTYRPAFYSAPAYSTTIVAPVGYSARTYYYPQSYAPLPPIGVTYGYYGYSTIGGCCY